MDHVAYLVQSDHKKLHFNVSALGYTYYINFRAHFWNVQFSFKILSVLLVNELPLKKVKYYSLNTACCVFRPANGCSVRRSLVKINFLPLKQLFA